MKYQKTLALSLLASCLASSGFSAVRADTETTQTTTTVTSGPTAAIVNLPATGRYVVVDPLTGQIQGNYDPTARLVEGSALHSGVVIVNETDGGPVGLVDASGNIVDVAVSPASQTLLVLIDSRRQDLNRRIDEALNKGLLKPTQAAAFRAELDRIAADEERERQAGGVTYSRALMLGYGLNTLSDRLVPLINVDTSLQPVIAPEFVIVNGHLTLLDTINYRKHHLETRCDDEYAAGRLSQKQVSRIKEDLSKISYTERKYIKHGALSSSKDQKLSEELDKLQSEMDSDVALINQKRSRIGIRAD
jgi:hypothetical protein